LNQPITPVQTADPWLRVPPPGHPLRKKIRDGLVALSIGNLCLITAWFSQLYDSDAGYNNLLPITRPSLLALAVNIIWIAAVAWLIMQLLRRVQNRWLHLLSHLLLVALLLLPIDFCRVKVFEITDYQVITFFRKPLAFLALLTLMVIIVWQHRRAARVAGVLIGILSPLALFTLTRIALLCLGLLQIKQYTGQSSLPPLGPVREGQPRVLWIIFDETDQRLAFEQRPARVQLPEFDRLRSESLYATNAVAPADATLGSLPQLISGRRVSAVSIKNASDLALTLADTNEVVLWSQLPSVFSSAREMGFNTALVGWYHPYSRVLSNALNYCVWYPYFELESTRAATFGAAMRRELAAASGTLHRRWVYGATCRASLKESLALVTNATYGLVFLHLPVPHKPGIYLPDKDRFTIFGMSRVTGYFNNLILADRYLGKLRRAMEASGEWDKTWVILSSDHSWRESRAYDGQRDKRVPFLLKAPGQSGSTTYSSPFNTVVTRDFILAIFRGEISGCDSAVAWLEAHGRLEPTSGNQGHAAH
jgi:hypothetical protein